MTNHQKQEGVRQTRQKLVGKHSQSIIIGLLTLIMITSLASATDFTTWAGGSPVSDQISSIRTFATTAMGITDTEKIIFFNGSEWNEIAKPTYSFGGVVDDRFYIEKSTDQKFHLALQNSTGDKEFWNYNPSTETWTLEATSPASEGVMNGFACIEDDTGYNGIDTDMECYWADTSKNVYGVNEAINLSNFGTGVGRSGRSVEDNWLKGGTQIFAFTFNSPNNLVYRNPSGVSWTLIFNSGSATSYDLSQTDDTHFALIYASTAIAKWNSSSSSFYTTFSGAGLRATAIIHQAGIYWASNTQIKKYSAYGDDTEANDLITSGNAVSIDCAYTIENCWAGTATGNLYHAGTITGSEEIDPAFNIIASANPNPSAFGTSTTMTATLTTTYSIPTYVQVEIYNGSGSSRYGFAGSTPTGNGIIDITTTIQGITWQNFENRPQTYTIIANTSDGTHTANYSFDWVVNNNLTTNQTNYSNTEYSSSGFTDVVALDNQGTNRVFAVGKNGSDALLISYDITNPNSIIRKSQIISGADTPTSIAISANRGFIGTNAKLFVFNNTQVGDATQATLNTPAVDYSGGSDYVYDVSSINNDYAWTCGQNNNLWITDEAQLFNYTLYDFQSAISADPCKTSQYANDLLFIHLGTGGIKIYNSTTQALIGSTSTFPSQPSGATHDRISIYGNYLFAITAQTYITKYNITDPTNPIELSRCYTSSEIQAIEALSENEVVFATPSQLKICDYSNNEKYDAVNQFYTSTQLKIYLSGENPTDIVALDDNGKYAVAEGTGIGIYYYAKNTIAVPNNQPPTISVSAGTTNPCINQTITFTITGSDPEGVGLEYQGDCTGIQPQMTSGSPDPQFTCTFTTAGTKTIKAFARENNIINTPVSAITTTNVQSCAYSNFLIFDIRDSLDATTPVSDVLVNVIGHTSGLTNAGGVISFNLPASGTYNVSFSKSGWLGFTNQYTTSSSTKYIYLQRDTDQSTILYTIVKDSQNNLLPLAHVSTTDPITSIAKFTDTDSTGTATLTGISSGTSFYVRITKDGYQMNSYTTSLTNGERKTMTITLLLNTEAQNKSSGRGCKDDIDDIILCSPLNISLDGDNCQQDTDCLSGRCELGIGTYRVCSTFNWSKCDAEGLDRGNSCFMRFTTQGVAKGATEVVLDNFLYVLVFIAFIILFLMIMRAVNRT
jgi:hypothetical protein